MPVSKCVFTFYIVTIIKYCQHTIMMQINLLLNLNNFDISNQSLYQLDNYNLISKSKYSSNMEAY